MKVAILAGGLGTRLSEETTVKPKPMVEIGDKPILWHIMNIYAAHGYKEFVVALGYKGEIIKDYFLNYHYHSRSLTVQLKTGDVKIHNDQGEDWIVHLLDTGADTNTGGRVKRLAEFVGNEPFMLDLWRRRQQCKYSSFDRFPQKTKQTCDYDRCPPACTFWADGHRRASCC